MYHHSHLAEEAYEEYKKRKMDKPVKVFITYHGDRSVGIQNSYHEMTVPILEDSEIEEIRQKIKELYQWLDGEYRVTVEFEGEQEKSLL